MDFASEYNVGCAYSSSDVKISADDPATSDGFVNFTSPSALLAFATSRLGTRWNSYHSDKLVVASYANIQVSFLSILLDSHFHTSPLDRSPRTRR